MYFRHFHMALVYIVKDVHKSLCMQKGKVISYAHDLSPINDTGGIRLENCSCHHVRNKTNEDTECDLKKLFNAQLAQLIKKEDRRGKLAPKSQRKKRKKKKFAQNIYQCLF